LVCIGSEDVIEDISESKALCGCYQVDDEYVVGFRYIRLRSVKTRHIAGLNMKVKFRRMGTNIRSPPSQEFDIDRPYAITKDVLVFHICGCIGDVV
jgi:hypothetical protein